MSKTDNFSSTTIFKTRTSQIVMGSVCMILSAAIAIVSIFLKAGAIRVMGILLSIPLLLVGLSFLIQSDDKLLGQIYHYKQEEKRLTPLQHYINISAQVGVWVSMLVVSVIILRGCWKNPWACWALLFALKK